MPLPDLESLRCFDAAARCLHFRLAAAQVALSPTAFSDRIRRLEDDLGAPLFERTTRRIVLTEAGLRLQPLARRLLDEARRLQHAVVDTSAPYDLTLGTRFELGLSWLVPALGTLEAQRPERTLHLRFGDSPDLLRGLRNGEVDGAVTSTRLPTPGLAYAPLHEEEYVFVASPELLDERSLCGPEDAGRHTLLEAWADLPLLRYLLDATEGATWAFGRVRLLGTIAAIRHRVLEGAGVAVLPRYFVAVDLAEGRLTEPLPDMALRTDLFRLLWREDHPLASALATLASDLRQLPLR